MALTAHQPVEELLVEPATGPVLDGQDAEAIDRIVDFAFWQLMLGDDLAECDRLVRLLVASIQLRWGQTRKGAQDFVR